MTTPTRSRALRSADVPLLAGRLRQEAEAAVIRLVDEYHDDTGVPAVAVDIGEFEPEWLVLVDVVDALCPCRECFRPTQSRERAASTTILAGGRHLGIRREISCWNRVSNGCPPTGARVARPQVALGHSVDMGWVFAVWLDHTVWLPRIASALIAHLHGASPEALAEIMADRAAGALPPDAEVPVLLRGEVAFDRL